MATGEAKIQAEVHSSTATLTLPIFTLKSLKKLSGVFSITEMEEFALTKEEAHEIQKFYGFISNAEEQGVL